MTPLFSIVINIKPYLDPGSGSMVVQMIIAGLLGVGVAIRLFWKKIRAFFNRK